MEKFYEHDRVVYVPVVEGDILQRGSIDSFLTYDDKTCAIVQVDRLAFDGDSGLRLYGLNRLVLEADYDNENVK